MTLAAFALSGTWYAVASADTQRPAPPPPAASTPEVGTVPDDLRARLQLAAFYHQHVDVHGFPIVGSAKVSPYAMREAAYLIEHMLGKRPEVLRAMADAKVRLTVMAATEYTTDVPEHSNLKPAKYWDKRARGLGASVEVPCVSCAEENLLGLRGDPYGTENIMIHELAHAVHLTGMRTVDPSFDGRLRAAFKNATEVGGLWKDKYAGSNAAEYFAEGVQSWFDTNRENDNEHNHVNTREELKAYDPALAKLVEEVYGDGPWRYVHPSNRKTLGHLEGFDRATFPHFKWRDPERTDGADAPRN